MGRSAVAQGDIDAGLVNGRWLVLTIDTHKSLGPSRTGRATVVASSGGWQEVEGVSYNITVIRPE